MARVLFVQDNGVNENLGLMSVAAVLREAGHQVELLLTEEHGRRFIPLAAAFHPDVIGLSFMTGNRRWARATASRLKAHLDTPIIAGGVHPTLFPEDIDFGVFDYACVGEGEYPMLELTDALARGLPASGIQNLWVKGASGIVRNPVRDLIHDLDSLPMPYRQLYGKYEFIRQLPVKRFITGLGCPFRCTFCHNPLEMEVFAGKGRYIRQKSVERVIAEIRDAREDGYLRRVHFSDDLFGLNRRWLDEFLAAYKRDVGLPFSCNVRVDLVDDGLARAMAEAGCWGVSFGIESGSEHLRNEILKKNLSDEAILANARCMKKHGIRLVTSNIFALPGETLDDAFKTLSLNQRLRPDYTRASILLPYPKTEIAAQAVAAGLLPHDFSIASFDDPANGGPPTLRLPHLRQLRNLRATFNLAVRFPWLTPVVRRVVNWAPTWLLAPLRVTEGLENMAYHQLLNLAGLRYGLHVASTALRDVWS
ncbi:MAG: B12-binding domain-containing radical SAM protein [Bacteroidales bacterium]